jgi:hypothetical protein
MSPELTKDRIELIYKLRMKGLTILDISLRTGHGVGTVSKYLKSGYAQWKKEKTEAEG